MRLTLTTVSFRNRAAMRDLPGSLLRRLSKSAAVLPFRLSKREFFRLISQEARLVLHLR
jgi:hypothetical protein